MDLTRGGGDEIGPDKGEVSILDMTGGGGTILNMTKGSYIDVH